MVPYLARIRYSNAVINMLDKSKLSFAFQELGPSSVATVEANTAPKVEEVRVDIADMRVKSRPVELLKSVGSCVAICAHDPLQRFGGLAHIMLPNYAGISTSLFHPNHNANAKPLRHYQAFRRT